MKLRRSISKEEVVDFLSGIVDDIAAVVRDIEYLDALTFSDSDFDDDDGESIIVAAFAKLKHDPDDRGMEYLISARRVETEDRDFYEDCADAEEANEGHLNRFIPRASIIGMLCDRSSFLFYLPYGRALSPRRVKLETRRVIVAGLMIYAADLQAELGGTVLPDLMKPGLFRLTKTGTYDELH